MRREANERHAAQAATHQDNEQCPKILTESMGAATVILSLRCAVRTKAAEIDSEGEVVSGETEDIAQAVANDIRERAD